MEFRLEHLYLHVHLIPVAAWAELEQGREFIDFSRLELEIENGQVLLHMLLGGGTRQGRYVYLGQVAEEHLGCRTLMLFRDFSQYRATQDSGVRGQGPEALINDLLFTAPGTQTLVKPGVSVEPVLH